jgi:glycosyltransferase involved in cell wall biosynthesis
MPGRRCCIEMSEVEVKRRRQLALLEHGSGSTSGLVSEGPSLSVLHCLWTGNIGGAERAVYQLVREQLHDSTLAPALLFAQGQGLYWEHAQTLGCPVSQLGAPHGHAVRSLRAAVSVMRDFDIHHFHSAEPLLMLASTRCPSARRVYTHRGGIIDYPVGRRIRYELTGALLKRSFHAFSGNTAHGARCAARIYRLPPERFRVTYNVFDSNLLTATRTRELVRAELALAPGDFAVGTTANLKRWKRVERLIDAVAALSSWNMRLLIVGDGRDRGRLEERARRRGVASRVIFAGLQNSPVDYLQAMDAFCLPSMGLESFGNAAVEAMALGLPTIVFSDGGGLVEHIEHTKTGFVVVDQDDLERTLTKLILEPELRQQVGADARASIRERYAPARAAIAFRALYADALREAEPRGGRQPGGS